MIELMINRVSMSYRHISMNLVIIGLYLAVNSIGQLVQDRPIYGMHLAIRSHYSNDFSWSIEKLDDFGIKQMELCKSHFAWDHNGGDKGFDIPNYQKPLWTSIATMVCVTAITHLLISFISQLKAKSVEALLKRKQSEENHQIEGEGNQREVRFLEK